MCYTEIALFEWPMLINGNIDKYNGHRLDNNDLP